MSGALRGRSRCMPAGPRTLDDDARVGECECNVCCGRLMRLGTAPRTNHACRVIRLKLERLTLTACFELDGHRVQWRKSTAPLCAGSFSVVSEALVRGSMYGPPGRTSSAVQSAAERLFAMANSGYRVQL